MPFITPNMGLTEPTIGVTTSPAWQAIVNANSSIIDQHNHTPGNGVPLTSASIDINADFSMNGFNLTQVNSLLFNGAVTGTPSTLSIYSNGTDFFFKDVNGNSIQLTKGGGPNSGTGNIQNLPSTPIGGAGISWVNSQSTFQFLQDSGSVGANIDTGSIVVRYPGSYPSPSGNFIELRAPTSLSTGYSLTLPSLPPGQQIMTLDAAGNISAPYTVDNSTLTILSNVIQVANGGIGTTQLANDSVTPAKQSTINSQLSSSCGSTGTNSTTFVDISNLSITITLSGNRPVMFMLVPDTSGTSYLGFSTASGTVQLTTTTRIVKDLSPFSDVITMSALADPTPSVKYSPSSIIFTDFAPGSGSHTYKIQAKTSTNTAIFDFMNVRLLAYEM